MEDSPNISEQVPQGTKAGRVGRQRPLRQLPTDRVSFSKQLDLLRVFAIQGASGKAVPNEQAAATFSMAPATTGLCNPFFVDVQLLQKAEGGLIPSTDVLAYERAYNWDSESAALKLQPTMERTWFAQTLIPRLKFRPLEEREALAVLAEESGASKEYLPQLKTLLLYLEAAGLITRDNGIVKPGAANTPEPSPVVGEVRSQPEGSAGESPGIQSPIPATNQGNRLPIPLSRSRLVYIDLPDDWNSGRDLPRLLKMLEISLTEENRES
jgi:hypothetical protein